MRLLILSILLTSAVISCKKNKTADVLSYRKGKFITYLDKKRDSSFFYRNDSIQIENYRGKIDSFSIHWKHNFEYTLKKINPKNRLDSIPFVVKINKIKSDRYEFTGNYIGSNFKQKGTSIKLKQ